MVTFHCSSGKTKPNLIAMDFKGAKEMSTQAERNERYLAKNKKAGIIRAVVMIPECNKGELQAWCKRKREQHKNEH